LHSNGIWLALWDSKQFLPQKNKVPKLKKQTFLTFIAHMETSKQSFSRNISTHLWRWVIIFFVWTGDAWLGIWEEA